MVRVLSRPLPWFAALIVLSMTLPGFAQSTQNRHTRMWRITPTGDLESEQEFFFSRQDYLELRSELPAPEDAARFFIGFDTWRLSELMQAEFRTESTSLALQIKCLGYVNCIGEGLWELNLPQSMRNAEVITDADERVVLHCVTSTSVGHFSDTLGIIPPPGAHDLQLNSETGTLRYRLTPRAAPSVMPRPVAFTMDGRKELMSSLANLHANPEAATFYVSRARLHNASDETLEDFRVRFRINGLSPWSVWQKSARVYPGQTVVRPFFPLLDIEAIRELSTQRTCQVEAEYRYRQTDGEQVEAHATLPLTVLPTHDVALTALETGETQSTFQQQLPNILPCYLTSEDPAIGQLAGRVSRMAGGAAAAADKKGASRFLIAYWEFLASNGLHCETTTLPPENSTERFRVRYPRHVLQDRRGTSLDLALLTCSVAQAVGLRTELVCTGGDSYPVIVMPDGDLVPVDMQLIGKTELQPAIDAAIETLEGQSGSPRIWIEISNRVDAGFRAIDLGPCQADFFDTQAYKFPQLSWEAAETDATAQPSTATTSSTTSSTTNSEHTSDASARDGSQRRKDIDARLCGAWHGSVVINGNRYTIAVRFDEEGRYAEALRLMNGSTIVQETVVRGRWVARQGIIYLTANDGTKFQEDYRFDQDGDVWVYSPDLDMEVEFHRGK